MAKRAGLPQGCALAPSLVESARDALEHALSKGAVALMIVYETRANECEAVMVPNLECVRVGLLTWMAQNGS
jgi:hypothetical protein